jgi:ABC-type Mn2+/Zn2+ transport system permease subunit
MGWLIDPFTTNPFLLRSLIAGILVSVACGIVGTLVVLRGLAFIGDALAHGVLPGIAVALLLGFPGIAGAALGALAMIGGISLITEHSRLSSDTAIGLLFVGMLALGVVIVSRSSTFTGDIVSILFGEILGISIQAVWIQVIATIVILVVSWICRRPFLLLCFNSEQAQVSGFSYQLYHNIMLALIAIAVIVSFQTVGTLLVFGMLLAPAGAGALVARRVEAMFVWAVGIGSVSVYAGLLASYYLNLAAASTVILVAVILFFIILFIKNAQVARRPRPLAQRMTGSRPHNVEREP